MSAPTYQVTDQEFAAVKSLSAPDRYEYFVKKVVDWREVWSIRDDEGWCLLSDECHRECVPVWPAIRYAAEYCAGPWNRCRPTAIALDTWICKWIPGMQKDGRLVAVFPIGELLGIVVAPRRLLEELQSENERYY